MEGAVESCGLHSIGIGDSLELHEYEPFGSTLAGAADEADSGNVPI